MATGNLKGILAALYSPYVAFVAVIMLVEYVVLKGSDRSDQYRRQLEAIRAKRHQDLLTLQKMESQLKKIDERLQESQDSGEWEKFARKTDVDLKILIEQLRSRI